MRIYGDKGSGNCLKVKYICDYLGLEYEWRDIDVLKGETRSEAFLAMNPAGQIPVVEFDDGRILTQSNAMLLYFARDSELVPGDAWRLAQVHQWLFWEQYSHEPTIAVCRFHKRYLGRSDAELDPHKVAKGNAALDLMEAHLAETEWLVGGRMTVADIALLAYTRLAHEGGFELRERPGVQAWVARAERALGW